MSEMSRRQPVSYGTTSTRREAYPKRTNLRGRYRSYETLVREAAEAVALPAISETVLRSDTLARVPAEVEEVLGLRKVRSCSASLIVPRT
jgi:hypothetical protein